MLTARHFRWLPNALTLSRAILAAFVFWAAVNENWVLGFWLLAVAFATDFFDGLAAKKLDAMTDIGKQFDRFADMSLAMGGLIGLAAAGLVPWWLIFVMPLAALFLGYDRYFWPKRGRIIKVRPMLSASYLFASWIVLAWVFAAQAYGWRWWYVAVTAAVGVTTALLKRHRFRVWLGIDPGALGRSDN